MPAAALKLRVVVLRRGRGCSAGTAGAVRGARGAAGAVADGGRLQQGEGVLPYCFLTWSAG